MNREDFMSNDDICFKILMKKQNSTSVFFINFKNKQFEINKAFDTFI